MICAFSSRSSRGLTAFTLPWVPTGMNAGVSITPCPVVSRPERAFVLLSVALTSNIGATLEMIAKRARIFVPKPRIGRVAHDLLGLVGAAIFLLQWQTIVFEKEIRPEGICAFVVSFTFYLLIQFLACFFLQHRRTATVAYAIVLAFTAIFLASIKPSFGLASLFVLSPIIDRKSVV